MLPVLDHASSKTSIATTNDEGGERKVMFKKDKRKSLSRRVSFSSTTRVKEFHEGQHEVRILSIFYDKARHIKGFMIVCVCSCMLTYDSFILVDTMELYV